MRIEPMSHFILFYFFIIFILKNIFRFDYYHTAVISQTLFKIIYTTIKRDSIYILFHLHLQMMVIIYLIIYFYMI